MPVHFTTEHTAIHVFTALLDSKIKFDVSDLIAQTGLDKSDRNQLAQQIEVYYKQCIADFETLESDKIRKFVFNSTEPLEQILSKFPDIPDDVYRRLITDVIDRFIECFPNSEKYRYAVFASPLMSKLKRQLLKKRPGVDQVQFEYILDAYGKKIRFNPPSERKAFDKTIEKVRKTGNYRDFTESAVYKLISVLVYHETSVSVSTLLSKWNADNNERDSGIKQAMIRTLYLIAYALRLNPDEFDRMIRGNLGYRSNDISFIWYPLDAESDIYRFGLLFGLPFSDADKMLSRYRELPVSAAQVPQDEAAAQITEFLRAHRYDSIPPENEFLELLCKLGAVMDFSADSDEIRNIRLRTAHEKLIELLRMLSPERVKMIRKAYQNASDTFDPEQYDPEILAITGVFACLTGQWLTHDKVNEKQINRMRSQKQTEKIRNFLYENVNNFNDRFKKNMLNYDEKLSLLHRLCDEDHVHAIAKNGMAGDPLTREMLRHLYTGQDGKVTRGTILRLAYLHALILRLTGECDEKGALQLFRQEADRMLHVCLYHPVHETIPHDLTICFALAETKRFPPLIYQMYQPRRIEKL